MEILDEVLTAMVKRLEEEAMTLDECKVGTTHVQWRTKINEISGALRHQAGQIEKLRGLLAELD